MTAFDLLVWSTVTAFAVCVVAVAVPVLLHTVRDVQNFRKESRDRKKS